MDQKQEQQIPSPMFRDISNFKTPRKTNPKTHNFETPFFTASKQTPKSSFSSVRHGPRYSLAAKKLKAVELEQSKSSRKTQTDKEKSLKSLAKSLTVWLNFLFENPRSCGIEISRFNGEDSCDESSSAVFSGGKRYSASHCGGVAVDREWRGPKRQKDMLWVYKGEAENKFSSSSYSRLKVSLGDICSLDDLNERMSLYLSLTSCHEILDVMTRVAKNIDEGRLKMKAHCPIVTDVGMKENALKVLMSYNPVWLRIGLYIIFGGESLLPKPNIDMTLEHEISFLKMVAEKLFFSHSGLAKAYIYNKLVDGLYRPGYYEKLGSVILKKFLLLALILDRAKSHSSLPISYGIDGLDGGSPMLFTPRATIKSSGEVISDFLSPDVMHGVGNLLTHLTIIGYKVSYQQNPLVKYEFKVTDLFHDLQDGVLLCRVIQLLQHDTSILKKVVVPSDDRKKHLVNCEISLKYLKQIRVPLCDEDGTEILTEDIVNGDKELIISLLWNIFVHLQLPLLINNKHVCDEITNIRGPQVQIFPNTSSHLEMLLEWIKAICDNYDLKVENFASLVDGKAMWCLLDFYFRKEHPDTRSNRDLKEANKVSIMSASDYVDAVHNFLLSQKLTTLLGNFPEVLQVSDILEYKGACSDRGVIILLVFLSSQLIVKRNLLQINFHKLLGHNQNSERKCIRREKLLGNHENIEEAHQNHNEDHGKKFETIMAWWKEMAQHNSKANETPVYTALQKDASDKQRENAAKIIQSSFRKLVEHQKYKRTRNTIYYLQTAIRVWLTVKNISSITKLSTIKIDEPSCDETNRSKRISRCLVDRHAFIKLKRSVVIVQHAVRYFINQKRQTDAAVVIQKCIRSWILRKSFLEQKQAAKRIEIHFHGWLLRKSLLNQKQATVKIQSCYRRYLVRKSFLSHKQAATRIQSHYRQWLSRNCFLKTKQAVMKLQRVYRFTKYMKHYKLENKSAVTIQSHTRGWIARRAACRCRHVIVLIQSICRGWLTRRRFLLQKEAATRIQSDFRCFKSFKAFKCYTNSAIVIQQIVRGCIARKITSRLSSNQEDARSDCNHDGILQSQTRTESAIVIQSNVRGWIARRATAQRRHRIAVIQSYWKGYVERKHARGKLSDIRLRVQMAAVNVDDGMRIINRLIAALSELKNTKSVSGILHTCATLDMATLHSQKCCEKLVDAGAINTLLELIRSISQSIADQEVLRHTLSTFRNLTRHPHLNEEVIGTSGSCQIILREFIRNKEDTYFIAADVLRNICSNKKGVEGLRNLHALVKRLHNLLEDLKKKAGNKRNPRTMATKEQTDRRLKEAVQILKLITKG
uniref:abnormal spindle-like microcephaly-associated protein n=1 Tax=Erigeron canadensis TaxID=72917 RepID=UPI001CB95577|nr:abnormal spindle-like microcephaly-associated protein [Erigeron canadensis]